MKLSEFSVNDILFRTSNEDLNSIVFEQKNFYINKKYNIIFIRK